MADQGTAQFSRTGDRIGVFTVGGFLAAIGLAVDYLFSAFDFRVSLTGHAQRTCSLLGRRLSAHLVFLDAIRFQRITRRELSQDRGIGVSR